MSTALQIGQAAERDTRAFGSISSTYVGASGDALDIWNAVIEAWIEIQNQRSDWRWMRTHFTGKSITDGTGTYAATDWSLTDVAEWLTRGPGSRRVLWTIYKASDGVGYERELTPIEYDTWLYRYQRGTVVENDPVEFAITPDNSVAFGPVPDTTYTVAGSYRQTPQTLSADADEPNMPARFHDAIRHLAVTKYAAADGDPNVFAKALASYETIMADLRRDQTPRITLGPALA